MNVVVKVIGTLESCRHLIVTVTVVGFLSLTKNFQLLLS